MDSFDSQLRAAPGPRDWTPVSGSALDRPPVEYHHPVPRGREASPWRRIGLLTLLTAATASFVEIVMLLRPDFDAWYFHLTAPLAVLLGIVAMVVFGELGVVNRVTAVMGLAIATVATIVLAASLTGFLDTALAAQPQLTPAAAVDVAVEQERTELFVAAGLAASMLANDFAVTGAYPADLPLAENVITTSTGTVVLPVGAKESYSSDGATYTLILVGAHGTVATVDSADGTVVTTDLVG